MSRVLLHDGIFDWEDLEASHIKSVVGHRARRMASMWKKCKNNQTHENHEVEDSIRKEKKRGRKVEEKNLHAIIGRGNKGL